MSDSRRRKPGRSAGSSYHHGDLRQALIAAAMQLADESGPAGVTVREAARRAGVSAGAPFRHFPSRAALMSAIAEEALRRFRAEFDAALAAAPEDPIERMRAIARAYLRWALRNPTHFEIVSTAALFDFGANRSHMGADDRHIREQTDRVVAEAFRRGQLRGDDPALILLAARAMLYGFARMKVDGHFPRWNLDETHAEETADKLIALFIDAIAKPA